MEGSDVLQTLAEVAIALTGFTGIVFALRGRSSPLSGFDRVRFRILLMASLAAVAFSLLPFLGHAAGASPALNWSLGSALALAVMVPIAIHDVRALRTHGDKMPRFDRRIAPVVAGLGSLLFAAQIANVAFLHTFAPYLAVPMWLLAFSAFQFARLLLAGESAPTG